ncbi:MAG: Hsp20/alpha crystallin family protein [Chitinophagaceae bacterium]|nr:Hsp20/alpha crystallin family protein [Chitinophagaceae bacterium]
MTHLKFSTRPGFKTFDHLFDELLNVNWNNSTKQSSTQPAVNIFETAEAYHLELNVPGRNKEDFKVNIENGLLTISYEKVEEKRADDYKTVRREFGFNNFSRSFHIDEKINAEDVQAKYENGLLKFWLPKKEQPKNEVKQIAVQ